MKPRLGVIIINWNTADLLRQCLSALVDSLAGNDHVVVVVDNGSHDDSVRMVRELFPDIVLIPLPENRGFSGANNRALEYLFAQSTIPDHILFLNSDIIPTASAIGGLVAAVEADAGLAAAVPALLLPDGSFQRGGAGYGPSARSAFLYYSLLHRVLPLPLARGMFIDQKRYRKLSGPVDVEWVAAACFLVKCPVVRSVGFWNERYFVYGEDADYCDRMRAAGWRIAYCPQLKVIHHHGASSRHEEAPNTTWLRALFTFVQLRRSFREYQLFRAIVTLGTALRIPPLFIAALLSGNVGTRRKLTEMTAYLKTALRGAEE